MYQSVSIVEEGIGQEAEISRNKKKIKVAEFKVKKISWSMARQKNLGRGWMN